MSKSAGPTARGRGRWDQGPRALAVSDQPLGIILSTLPGEAVREHTLTPAQERNVFEQAGVILADWHRAGPGREMPDMVAWVADRGEQWLHLAREHRIMSPSRRADIRAHLRQQAELEPVAAVPCHLDFAPRDFVRSADGIVGVIDFENARYDLAARDLVRLVESGWLPRPELPAGRPDLRDAFLSSHGRLSALDEEIIEHCLELSMLTAAVSAADHFPQDG